MNYVTDWRITTYAIVLCVCINGRRSVIKGKKAFKSNIRRGWENKYDVYTAALIKRFAGQKQTFLVKILNKTNHKFLYGSETRRKCQLSVKYTFKFYLIK